MLIISNFPEKDITIINGALNRISLLPPPWAPTRFFPKVGKLWGPEKSPSGVQGWSEANEKL